VLLEVEAINTFRGPAHILRGVTLSVGDGEVVSLVGRNGAGRTTIIESITGLLPVRSGHIRFRGEDITKLPPHKRAKRGIGYAPENSGIFPELTVAENLMISRWLSDKTARGAAGGVDAEAQALTVFPEVAKFLERPGLNLSGGQKKMVSIARAMALAPSLMILAAKSSSRALRRRRWRTRASCGRCAGEAALADAPSVGFRTPI
jgi:branched-chain amino acid transport system ATP-binding protein